MNTIAAYPVEFLSEAPPALTGCFCTQCCEMFYPARAACPRCGSTRLAEQGFSGKGDVYSFTVERAAPAGYVQQAPYAVVMVHLAEGPYVTARLVGVEPASLFIGMPLEAVPGEDGRVFRLRRSLVD